MSINYKSCLNVERPCEKKHTKINLQMPKTRKGERQSDKYDKIKCKLTNFDNK